MTSGLEPLRDACRLLGGLLLEGANAELLAELEREELARRIGGGVDGALAAPLVAVQEALARGGVQAAAAEYTRLTVADGPRSAVAVPLWEDVHLGGERRVMAERSRAVLKAYVAAGLGFEGMKQVPSDHVGLELLFTAALLDEESRGERDTSARAAFVEAHLGPLLGAVAGAITSAARTAMWQEVARALVALAPLLRPAASA